MYTVTKRISFDAAHRLSKHQGKCSNIHGHTYVSEVTLSALRLNEDDMVMDFGSIKGLIQAWIDIQWDHALLLNSEDLVAKTLEALQGSSRGPDDAPISMRLVLFEQADPTAEVMAEVLFGVVRRLIEEDVRVENVRVDRVRIYETPTGWADYTGLSR